MAPDKIKNTVDYTGIVLFWRKHCGTDFLNGMYSFRYKILKLFGLGFMDGRLSFDVLDHGNYYTPEHGVYRDDKSQSNVALQFRYIYFRNKYAKYLVCMRQVKPLNFIFWR